ncbi:MAG: hypothetical protein IKW38_06145 [Kiritimatiellae bacterium]|nr:hypothetical protein [Kiritimatiellia bacterium]
MANNAKTALLCAYTLAKAKQYAEAEALILSHEELAKTPEAIDLLARMRLEEGDEAEARRLWQSIQAVYPEHAPSRTALKLIGKRPFKIDWVSILSVLALVLFCVGFFLGSSITKAPQPNVTTVQWDKIPTQAKLDALSVYKGGVKRVCIASHFFSDPDRIFSRQLLTEYVGKALDLPASAIFIGEAPEALGEEAITVDLLRQ